MKSRMKRLSFLPSQFGFVGVSMHPIPALVITVTSLFIFFAIIFMSLDGPIWMRAGVVGVQLVLLVAGLILATSPSRSVR